MFNNTTLDHQPDGDSSNQQNPVLGHTFNIIPITIVMTIVGCLGNLAIIVAFLKDRNVSSKPSDYVVLNLTCADLGVTLLVLPRVTLVKSIGYWPFGEIGCRLIANFVDNFFLNAGILMVLLLSWDRYKMLVLNYSEYLNRHTKTYLLRAIALAWVLSSLQGLVENITWSPILASLSYRPNFGYVCVPPSLLTFSGAVTTLVLKIASVVAVGTFGVLIVLELHKRLVKWQQVGPLSTANEGRSTSATSDPTQNVVNDSNSDVNLQNEGNSNQRNDYDSNPTATQQSNQSHHQQQHQDQQQEQQHTSGQDNRFHKRYTKPIVTYVLLVLSLLVCNLPLFVYTLIVNSCMECRSIYTGAILNYLTCLVYFNSCLNPLLYGFTNARIRSFYMRKLKILIPF